MGVPFAHPYFICLMPGSVLPNNRHDGACCILPWIEMRVRSSVDRTQSPSRPTRGAWIEIFAVMPLLIIAFVAPHTGRVD